jgi:hypothetical protein
VDTVPWFPLTVVKITSGQYRLNPAFTGAGYTKPAGQGTGAIASIVTPYNPNRVLTEDEIKRVPVIRKSHLRLEEEDDVIKFISRSKGKENAVKQFILQGDSGTGKTELVQTIASRLNLPYTFLNCNPDLEKYELSYQVLPEDQGDGKMAYRLFTSEVVNAFEKGYVLEIQEPNIAPPGSLVTLNNMLQSNESEVILPDRRIKRHPDFMCLMTMNKESYSGTSGLNQSVISRCARVIKLDMPTPQKALERCKMKNPEIAKFALDALKIIETAYHLKKYSKDMNFGGDVDFRGLFELFDSLVYGDEFEKAFLETLLYKVSVEDLIVTELIEELKLNTSYAGLVRKKTFN